MDSPSKRPDVIVVPHRPGGYSRRLILPLGVMLLAGFALALRSASPDWRGLWQEIGFRADSLFARKSRAVKPAVEIARAELPTEKPKGDPITPKEKTGEAVAPKDKSADKAAAKDKAAAWDDIKRDVEKAQADRAEAERIKEKAADDLAKNPPPPPIPRNGIRRLNPAEMERLRAEMLRDIEAQMAEHRRAFEEMVRQFEPRGQGIEPFGRNVPRGFGQIPPGFGNFPEGFGQFPRGFGAMPDLGQFFADPLPGMDRMGQPLPGMDRLNRARSGQPQVREESGEKIIDGVKWKWRTRTMVNGG